MPTRLRLVLLAVAASLLGGLALDLSGGQLPWLVARASGLVAFGLLSLSVAFGLFMSTKLAKRVRASKHVFEVHSFLSLLTLAFIGVHGGSLLFDGFFHFTPLSVLVPFAAPYRPFWVGLGIIGAWLTALVSATSWFRAGLSYARWRQLHYLTFGAYFLSLLHGISSGSDTPQPAVTLLYVGSAAIIGGLILYRVMAPPQQPARSRAPRTAARATTR